MLSGHEAVPTLGGLAALLMVLAAAAPRAGADGAAKPRVCVVIGEAAPELERFAAEELCAYLQKLFGVRAGPTTTVSPGAQALVLIGSPGTNPVVKRATAQKPFPPVSDQGLVLRRLQFGGRPAFVVGGGSPQATLWAVYELVERWGVRYLLHGDVLPEPSAFRLPNLDAVLEPQFRVRQWRVVNDFAMGPESWGIADYRPVLDQLAKMKLNRIFVSTYPYQPFLSLEFRGVKRRQAWLWYDYHFPITDDMIGRSLFPDRGEFWNPDLPRHASHEEFAAAGERHVRAIMDYARQRGMQVVMHASVLEYPPEFAGVLPGAQKAHQLGEMWIVPGPDTDVDDPTLGELAATVLRTTVNTYPEADYLALGMPEFRQWSAAYEKAWQTLDRRYDLSEVRPLDDLLAAARNRRDYPGGPERAVQEVKGDIVALYFFDRLLAGGRVLQGSRNPRVRLIFDNVAEELFPILARISPAGTETMNTIDYTPSRVLQRRAALRAIPARQVPSILICTLHDDNVGVLPQLMAGSLQALVGDMREQGWAGFSTRYWLVGDHDPCVAYLARAAWHADTTPEAVYRDQVTAACGAGCVEDMLAAFREGEAATVQLEWHGLGLAFPVPGMMLKNWTPEPMSADLMGVREGYCRALAAATRARAKATAPGRPYVQYWIGRLQFGIGYLDAVEALHDAAMAERDQRPQDTLQYARQSLAATERALRAYADVARDRSDLGAIATMNEFVYRPLRARVAELEQGASVR